MTPTDEQLDAIWERAVNIVTPSMSLRNAIINSAFAAGAASVPREPTISMIQAGCEAYIECQRAEIAYACTSGQQPAKGPEHIWRAMHDAATGVTK